MKGEPEILHEIPVDKIESRDLTDDTSSLLLEVGLQDFSPEIKLMRMSRLEGGG